MTFRGKTASGETVEGYYFKNVNEDDFIITREEIPPSLSDPCGDCKSIYNAIIPETLAMETGKEDKNGKMIFGSIEVNGVMSKGGDVILLDGKYKHPIIFKNGSFWAGHMLIVEHERFEIIGTQGDVLICNNCKKYWKSPKERCTCGSTTLTKTDDRNIKLVLN